MKFHFLTTINSRLGKVLPACLALSLAFTDASAEGSKDLYPNGATGKRAYLMSRRNLESAHFAPFQTPGRMKVYAKPGEKIYLGSSMQGKTNGGFTGHMVVRKPNGTLHSTSGSSTTVGLIANRAEELGGPHIGSGSKPSDKYRPYVVTVGAGEEGVWEIDFMSIGSGTNHASGTMLDANGNWTQSTDDFGSALIAAWDVTVVSADNQKIDGRLFTTLFVGTTLNSQFNISAFYGNFYVLTPDGFSYKVGGNGMNGASFSFFSNNKGPKSTSSDAPNYKSFSYPTSGDLVSYISSRIWDPRNKDVGTNVTNKLFYNKPAEDLPESATWTNGPVSLSNPVSSTWLRPSESYASVSDLGMTCDGNISFKTNKSINYTVKLYKDGSTLIRTFTGASLEGVTNVINWDKKTAAGVYVTPGDDIKISVVLNGGEVHFPLIDAESNNNGLHIQLLDENFEVIPGKDSVYWDDSDISSSGLSSSAWGGRPTPLSNLVGRKSTGSTGNGHIWTSSSLSHTGENDYFGNNKVLDTWTYINTAPVEAIGQTCMEIHGYVWNDPNGDKIKISSENFVSGHAATLAPVIATEPLYVNLIDDADIVISTQLVDASGHYSFKTVPAHMEGLKLQLSKNPGIVGATYPATELPNGWVNTGELSGLENAATQIADSDGIINLNTLNIAINSGFNFGIQERPFVDSDTIPSTFNPGGENPFVVSYEYFHASDNNSGFVDSIQIISFPTNTTTLYIDGLAYTAETFPVDGIRLKSNTLGQPENVISVDPYSGDTVVVISYKSLDNAQVLSQDTGTVMIPFHTYTISGQVFHDADGMTNDSINGTALPILYKLALISTHDDVLRGMEIVNPDGSYSFEQVEGDYEYRLELMPHTTPSSDMIGDSDALVVDYSLWRFTGESLAPAGHDGLIDGKLTIGYLTGDVDHVYFGVQQPPMADEKNYTIDANSVSVIPTIPGFDPIAGHYSISMSSSDLTGYDAFGSLSGTDYEDCGVVSSCHSGTNTTFTIDSIYAGTRLFYDFGGSVGVQEIIATLEEPVRIENFEYDKMMIYMQTDYMEFGFYYSIVDKAGFSSESVHYSILTGSVLNDRDLVLTTTIEDSKVNLTWHVNNETDTRKYQVMRSQDGRSWETISFVNAHSFEHSPQYDLVYSYKDNTSKNGLNFYRITQLLNDGTYHYSNISKVERNAEINLNLYPNPAREYVTLSGMETQSKIVVYSTNGMVLDEFYSKNDAETISLLKYSPGLYLIVVFQDSHKIYQSILTVQ